MVLRKITGREGGRLNRGRGVEGNDAMRKIIICGLPQILLR
jgi:hypothetical protein